MEKQLALCGVTPEEIDYVVISHLHHDHAGKIGDPLAYLKMQK